LDNLDSEIEIIKKIYHINFEKRKQDLHIDLDINNYPKEKITLLEMEMFVFMWVNWNVYDKRIEQKKQKNLELIQKMNEVKTQPKEEIKVKEAINIAPIKTLNTLQIPIEEIIDQEFEQSFKLMLSESKFNMKAFDNLKKKLILLKDIEFADKVVKKTHIKNIIDLTRLSDAHTYIKLNFFKHNNEGTRSELIDNSYKQRIIDLKSATLRS